ncbi:MAG: hypothetical protein WAO15_14285 [Mycobacterium sp.]
MDDDRIDTEANVRTAERIADAPLPTGATLRMRQKLIVQFWRFVRINLKMMRIIYSGHG